MFTGYVSYGDVAPERHEVMLAHTPDSHARYNDHLIRVHGIECRARDVIPGHELTPCIGEPTRRIPEPFPAGVFPDGDEEISADPLEPFIINGH